MSKTLVLWEFAKKQNYIFKSNKLIENVGASLIIKDKSENFEKYDLHDNNFITKGGGKTIYLFDSDELASQFIKSYSKDLLRDFLGIEIFFVKTKFDDENDDYKEKIEELYNKLEIKKNKRERSSGLVGFGIERKCQSTGMPASYFDKDKKDFISSEVELKRRYARNQEKEFNELITEGYKLEKEIEKLINKDKKNYIAIIHIDGNSMGKKLKGILDNVKRKSNESQKDYNNRCISKMKIISNEINDLYKNAFKNMVQAVVKNEEKIKDFTKIEEKVLPIRPLILAGDDVTFITAGVIGIESARIMLENISKNEVIIDGENIGRLTACAGISIIKSGYPFIRAYNMAEELCQSAKRLVLETNKDVNALDYHISQGEINKSIKEIRDEYYTSEPLEQKGNLTMKPLLLNSNEGWKNYDNLCEAIENVEKAINAKDVARGKIKELRSVFKNGEEATKMFFKFYNIVEGKYLRPLQGTKGDYCFNTEDNENKCMYLDAIETYEYFIKLDEK